MTDPSEKNTPARTLKIPAEELRELLSHPDAKPVVDESPKPAEKSTESADESKAE